VHINWKRINEAVLSAAALVLLAHVQGGAADRGTPWPRHVIDNSSSGADGAKLADVDSDGLMDIATGWEQGRITRVYLNPSAAGVTYPWPAVTVGQPGAVEDAVFVDVDGDGAVDVVSSAEAGAAPGPGVFIHWAPTNPLNYLNPYEWYTGDPLSPANLEWMFAEPMQVDGWYGVDIVAGGKNAGAKIGWFQSPPDPHELSAWQFHEMSGVGWTMSLILHDMDGDYDTDVVVTDRKTGAGLQGARWLENPGSGSAALFDPWPNHFIGAQSREVMFAALSDLDGDGWDDFIVPIRGNDPGDNALSFFRRTSPVANWWAEFPIQVPGNVGTCKAANVGDIDCDGDPDVVLSFANADGDRSGVIWMSYVSSPTEYVWEDHEISGPEGIKFDLVPLLDLDRDGDLDVITTEENTNLGVIWYENPTMSPIQIPPGHYQEGWNLTSVPVEPGYPDPTYFFQDLCVLGNTMNGNLYRYDTGSGYRMYPDQFTSIARGQGYWLWLDAADAGTVVRAGGRIAEAHVMLPLSAGWNLIGHPHTEPLLLSECLVSRPTPPSTLNYGDAVAAGWVGGSLYYWEPDTGYHVVKAEPFGQDGSLRPWYGYWLYAYEPELTVIIPKP